MCGSKWMAKLKTTVIRNHKRPSRVIQVIVNVVGYRNYRENIQ